MYIHYIIECISYKVICCLYILIFDVHTFNISRKTRERIKKCMDTELPELQKLYEENRKMQNIQQRKDNED